ncbi:MAG: HEAT repeat domain-containing protein [Elusimicrobia bacterium]|nr:HEAT repeat domain-containing protein [Elusimicrobiota bacterium]
MREGRVSGGRSTKVPRPRCGVLGASLLWALGSWASAAGTTAGAVLGFDNGARGIAMGGAYAALARDVSGGLHWNPGGLGFLEGYEFEASYASLYAGMNHGYLGGGRGFGRWGGLAVGMSHLDAGPQLETRSDPAGGYTMTGSFRPWARVVSAGYGWSASSPEGGLGVGAVAKTVEESILNDKNAAAGFDIGVMVRQLGGLVSLGVAVQNMGSRYGLGGYRLPQSLRTGVGAEWRGWAGVLDLVVSRGEAVSMRAGMEYLILRTLALRAGFDSSLASDLGKFSGLQGGLSAGMGMRVRDYRFDYAFTSAGGLGATHRFTLGVRWGPPAGRGQPEARPKPVSRPALPAERRRMELELPSAPGLEAESSGPEAGALPPLEPSVPEPVAAPEARPTKAPPSPAARPKPRPYAGAAGSAAAARALLESLAASPRGSTRREEVLGLLLAKAADLRPLRREAVVAVNAALEDELGSSVGTNANRLLAIRLIGAIGDPETGPLVQSCLFNPDAEVAAEAAQALAATGAKASLEALENVVRQLGDDPRFSTAKGKALAPKMRAALNALRSAP